MKCRPRRREAHRYGTTVFTDMVREIRRELAEVKQEHEKGDSSCVRIPVLLYSRQVEDSDTPSIYKTRETRGLGEVRLLVSPLSPPLCHIINKTLSPQ